MVQFIFTNLLMLSLGTILYLIVRALPRLDKSEVEGKVNRSGFERWLVSDLPEKADLFLSSLLSKWLRKTKILLLKLDNWLGHHLKRFSSINGKSENGTNGFKDMRELE